MNNDRRIFRLAATAAAALFATAVAWAQDHSHMQMPEQAKQQTLKTGKKGEIHLNHETKVGDLTLKPGDYVVQHRVEGSDHFVHFIEMGKTYPAYPVSSEYAKSRPGEVKCQLQPLDSKAAETAVYVVKQDDGTWRATKVVVRGENVAHLR